MRRLVVLALLVTAATIGAAPASATCMETFNRAGVRMGTCSAPGGTPSSYVCVHDECVWH